MAGTNRRQVNDAYAAGKGLSNADVCYDDWPILHLRCEPDHYWQRNGLYAGQSVFLLLRQVPGWPNQSVLGLPLLCDRYCIFDRSSDGDGRIRLARARAED